MNERDRLGPDEGLPMASDAACLAEAHEPLSAVSQLLAGWPLAELPEHVRGLPQVGQLRPSVRDSADEPESYP